MCPKDNLGIWLWTMKMQSERTRAHSRFSSSPSSIILPRFPSTPFVRTHMSLDLVFSFQPVAVVSVLLSSLIFCVVVRALVFLVLFFLLLFGVVVKGCFLMWFFIEKEVFLIVESHVRYIHVFMWLVAKTWTKVSLHYWRGNQRCFVKHCHLTKHQRYPFCDEGTP